MACLSGHGKEKKNIFNASFKCDKQSFLWQVPQNKIMSTNKTTLALNVSQLEDLPGWIIGSFLLDNLRECIPNLVYNLELDLSNTQMGIFHPIGEWTFLGHNNCQ